MRSLQGLKLPWYIPRLLSSPVMLVTGFALGAALGGASFPFLPKQYTSSAKVLFGGGTGISLPAGLNLGGGATSRGFDSLMGFGGGKAPSSDIVQAILTSEGASDYVIKKLDLVSALKLPKSHVLALRTIGGKHLGVRKVRSVLVEISFRAPNPELAQKCVTEYLRYCDDYTSKNAVTSSRRTRIFIDSKVQENEQQIKTLERRLKAFLDAKGLMLMEAEPEVGGKILADAARAHFESQAQAAATRARLESLSARANQAVGAAQADSTSPIASSDPLVLQTQTSLARAQLELDNLEMTMTSAHPKVIEARRRVEELRGQLAQRLQSSAQATRAGEMPELVSVAVAADSADALRDRQEKVYSDTVQSVRASAGLAVDQQLLKTNLEGLLRRRELLLTEQARARIAEEQESLKLEVMDQPSLPDRHDWPKLSILLMMGAGIGTLLALAVNFWKSRPRR